jgi:hypothetical protein
MRSEPGQDPVFYARQTPPTILEYPVDAETVPLAARKLLQSEEGKRRNLSKDTMTKIQHEINENRKKGTDVYGDRLIEMGLRKQ